MLMKLRKNEQVSKRIHTFTRVQVQDKLTLIFQWCAQQVI
jgi:hypothetical protein